MRTCSRILFCGSLDPFRGDQTHMPSPDERIGPQYEYLLDLLNSDLPTLVVNYDAFETRVENDVFMLFLRSLEQEGADPQGSLLVIDKVPYRLTVDETSMDRSLTLYLVPWGETNPKLITSTVEVEHFGRIRRINVQWPEAIMRRHESLPALLRRLVLDSYIALQVMFVSRYTKLTESLFL